MIKHCPGCLRHAETDVIPASSGWWQGKAFTIPAQHICTHCGHSYGFEETA